MAEALRETEEPAGDLWAGIARRMDAEKFDSDAGADTGTVLPRSVEPARDLWPEVMENRVASGCAIAGRFESRCLPPREYRSGLGEMAKYHFLGGEDLDGLPLPRERRWPIGLKGRWAKPF